jgi:hypothetical protein
MIRLKSLLNESVATADSIAWAKKFQSELGLTPEAAAAMAANIQHESGFIPDRIQGAGIKTGTMADSGKLGYSWAQWTFGPRKQSFRKFILNTFNVDINKQPATNKHAYAFLKSEIGNYPGFNFNKFKQTTNIKTATAEFVQNYEQAGKPMLNKRIAIANEILNNLKPTEQLTASDFMMPVTVPRGSEITITINKNKLPLRKIELQIKSTTGKVIEKPMHTWNNIEKGILKFDAPKYPGLYTIYLPNTIKTLVVT